MRDTLAPYPEKDIKRDVSVAMYRGARSSEIVSGTATPTYDLTPFLGRSTFSDNKMSVRLAFLTEFFDCNNQPRPGDYIAVTMDNNLRAVMAVSAISDFTETRGTRSMTVTCRTRDGFDGWRNIRAASSVFPLGTNYKRIMEIVCDLLMDLEVLEYDFPDISYSVPHSNVQLADMSPWDMLEKVAEASSLEPFVDVLDRVRAFPIATDRTHDIAIANDRIVSFKTARQSNRSGSGSVRIKWLDPELKKQVQPDQVLGSEIITAGFFKLKVTREVWYSSDRRQRVDNAHMKIVDSCNNGLLGISVADEKFDPVDLYHGEIILETYWWVPTLYTVSLGVLLATSEVPDGVAGTSTVPVGRVIHGIALITMMGIMLSIGTGTYEVWGQPYDMIHATNTTVARACNLPYSAMNQTELESSLIQSEAHAQDAVTKLLLYLNAANYNLSATIIDDPRIEKGDILLFEDGSRFMVQSFNVDFSRGAEATMTVGGYLL